MLRNYSLVNRESALSASNSEKLIHLEILRGICILLVLLYHLQIPGFEFGYLGVDLFFVISGFLMAKLYGDINSRAALVRFLVKRGARLLPAYLVVLFVVTGISSALLLPHEIESIVDQGIWSAFLLPNVGFWNDVSYFDYLYFRPLLNFWSLGVELQFYVLFPPLVFIARRSWVLLLSLTLGSFFVALVTSEIDPQSAFFLLPARLWEFMAGYYIVKGFSSTRKSDSRIGSVSLLALIVLIVIASDLQLESTFLLMAAVTLLGASVISNGIHLGAPSNPLRRSLVTVGQYSYSIYLVHFPVIAFYNYQPFDGTLLGTDSFVDLIVILLITGILSWLLYTLVEQTTRYSLSGRVLTGMIGFSAVLSITIAQPAVNVKWQLMSEQERLIALAMTDTPLQQCDSAVSLPNLRSRSCLIAGADTSEGKRFMIAGNSHADSIKDTLGTALENQGHSLRWMIGYRAIEADYDGEAIIQEVRTHDIEEVVIHQTLTSDNGLAIGRFANNAAAENIHVHFIAPIPRYEDSVPKTLLDHWRSEGESMRNGQERELFLTSQRELRSNLQRFTRELSNFSWYDPTEYLCDAEFCVLTDSNGAPLYYDSNHLTNTGAAQLIPLFEYLVDRNND